MVLCWTLPVSRKFALIAIRSHDSILFISPYERTSPRVRFKRSHIYLFGINMYTFIINITIISAVGGEHIACSGLYKWNTSCDTLKNQSCWLWLCQTRPHWLNACNAHQIRPNYLFFLLHISMDALHSKFGMKWPIPIMSNERGFLLKIYPPIKTNTIIWKYVERH